MRVVKWANGLAIRLPAAVIEVLDLNEGDEIELRAAGDAGGDRRSQAEPRRVDRTAARISRPPARRFLVRPERSE
jgi:antitoxin MazE